MTAVMWLEDNRCLLLVATTLPTYRLLVIWESPRDLKGCGRALASKRRRSGGGGGGRGGDGGGVDIEAVG